jgi:hypothetical protein
MLTHVPINTDQRVFFDFNEAPMEIHTDMVSIIIDCTFGIIMFLAGFLLKAMWTAIDKLREDMLELNKAIARDYVRRDDFQGFAGRVEHKLDTLIDRLNDKADKP